MATAPVSTEVEYEVVIGLEVHAQLLTASKMFCRCSADYAGAPPNTHCCPICMGFPGVLPVINEQAVDFTIMTALALNCTIAEFSKFDRKNYFYPDLPKGYQISQYDIPLSRNGFLTMLIAALLPPPTPFKPFVIAAGVFRVPLRTFTLALLLARMLRYFGEGFLAVRYGTEAIRYLLEKKLQFSLIVLAAILVGYFILHLVFRRAHRKA